MQGLVAVLLLHVGAFSLSRLTKLEGAVSYLVLLTFSLDLLYFGALVDLLAPATAACFVGFLLLLVLALVKGKGRSLRQDLKAYANLHTVMNGVCSVLFAVLYEITRPVLYYWDEIKIWGPTAKAVKEYGRLYSIGVNPLASDRNYPAGNALLNYFFSFFAKHYDEKLLLLSYCLLFFAIFAAASQVVETKTGNRMLSVGAFLAMFLLPFVQNYHTILENYRSISYVYGTSMVDFNVGAVFFAAVVLYFHRPQAKWYLLPAVFLVTVKKNGVFFALLLFCIVACVQLFEEKWSAAKLRRACVQLVLALVIPLVAYAAWDLHLDHYAPVRSKSEYTLTDPDAAEKQAAAQADTPQQASAPDEDAPAPVVKRGETTVLALLVPSLRTARYQEILAEMKSYLLHNKELVGLRDCWLIALLLAVGVVTALTCRKRHRWSLLLTAVGLTAACFIYVLVISYQMQFYNDRMVEYPRYMLSFYYGWVYTVLFLFLCYAQKGLVWKQTALCALVVLCMGHVYRLGLEYTVIDCPENVYQEQLTVQANARWVQSQVEPGARIYLVMPDMNHLDYCSYRYHLLPNPAGYDTSYSGVNFDIPFRTEIDYKNGPTYYNVASPETFAQVMLTYFDYVYIVTEDEAFAASYGALFNGELRAGTLYRVTEEPIPMQVVAE